jgi:hypothetical protein
MKTMTMTRTLVRAGKTFTCEKRVPRDWIFAVLSPGTALASLSLAAVCLSGCSGPITDPSPLMLRTSAPTGPPPADKALVLIHRPRAYQGYVLYTGVWDGTNFVADLGNGHSVAYPCDPGQHYFINRSVERVGVVEAQLQPRQIYDLRLDTANSFIASFQIEPINAADPERKNIAGWEKEHLWVTRGPAAAKHEQDRQRDIQLILRDFITGDKKDRLRHLGADDHR